MRRFQVQHVAWLAFAIAATWLYRPVVSKLFFDWWHNPDYSHGFLVAPVALWIMWRRWREQQDPLVPARAGLAIVCLAAALLVVGRLGAELFLTRTSLVLLGAGAVVFLRGWRALRPLLFPLALIALTIPLPAIVIGRIAVDLQLAASSIAGTILGMSGVPVLVDGNVLVLPDATLQVAEACSGIRSLAALFTLGLLVARSAHGGWLPRAIVIAAAVPVAVAVNGLRVTATAYATFWWGTQAAEGAVHEIFGLLMFGLALACLQATARAVGGIATHLEQLERAPV